MISVDFHVKGMQELEDRFDRMEHATKKKIIRRILQFSFTPTLKAVKALSPYSQFSNKSFTKSFRDAWQVRGYAERMPTVVLGVKSKNPIKKIIGNTTIYESSAYTRYWNSDGTKERYTKSGRYTGRIKGTKFTDIALKSTQKISFDRFIKKMKKELDKL
jgi:hypothetical protein